MTYLKRFFLCTSLIVGAICTTNWFVDPFGMYWSPVVSGLNATKPASGDRVRVTKAYRAPAVAPDILIVGNSRAEMALFPAHQSFEQASVYNQAMPGAGVRLQTDYALNTLHASPELRKIIMSVDYLDFLVREDRLATAVLEEEPDHLLRLPFYTPGWEGRMARLRENSALLFSLDGLMASANTIARQGAYVNSIDADGFNEPAGYIDILRNEGINALFVQKLLELDGNMRGRNLVTTDVTTGDRSPQHDLLANFLAAVANRGVQVQLFISPYHLSYLHLLDDLGMTEDFLAWKRNLLDIVAGSDGDVELWDFSGPSDFIQEPVPVGSRQAMQWYWEPAHYRRELGDFILEALATGGSQSGFGVRLDQPGAEMVADAHRALLNNTRSDWQTLQQELGIRIAPVSR